MRMMFAVLLVGCAPTISEGHYACADDDGCPSGWTCLSGRCWDEQRPSSMDGGLDAGHDAGPDAMVADAAIDSGPGTPVDAGPDAGPRDAGVDGGCTPTAVGVDLLVLVDNSNSMAEEQATLVAELPAIIDALARGDSDGDGRRDFTPVDDLHVGVVSTDMGTSGFTIPTCNDSDFGDDGILNNEPASSMTVCAPSYPPFLDFEVGVDSIADFRRDFACIGTLGTGGCGFERQLDAVLKAVTPSTSPLLFERDSRGHGDRANNGFLRDDSVLVVLLVTDEDDCSVADPAFFDPAGPYSGFDLNLRCHQGSAALHGLDRYVDGLRALRTTHPERLVFMTLTGIPLDVDGESLETILADPDMLPRIDPSEPNRLVPACNNARGRADPAQRLVQTALEIDRTESTGLARSICQTSYADGLSDLLRATVAALGGTCD